MQTQLVVKNFEKRQAFYTNIVSSFWKYVLPEKENLNGLPSNKQIEEFYQNTSFCNYIQHILAESGECPFDYIKKHNEEYKEYLIAKCNELKPDILILTSYRFDIIFYVSGIVKYLNESKIKYINVRHLSKRPINDVERLNLEEELAKPVN